MINYPVLNAKTSRNFFQNRQYVFEVDVRLNKLQIKKIIEEYFNVKVEKIQTNMPPRKKITYIGTPGLKSRYKKAIIKLKENQSIPYIENLTLGLLNRIRNNVPQEIRNNVPQEKALASLAS
uniref:ribosomal protein L23 n=1 Tax=Hydrocytium acuminatum TaxID=1745963 RepID=UPI002A837A66|nr:ribosomal protein L23 [Hydrocytium acuminatum]WOR09567.1 ribosomal protein L23 [Hydrocytium acuminatum]